MTMRPQGFCFGQNSATGRISKIPSLSQAFNDRVEVGCIEFTVSKPSISNPAGCGDADKVAM